MAQLKTNFAVSSKYEAFYTGGKIQISGEGGYMFCGCGNKVNILEVATGKVHSCIGEEQDEEISNFCLTPDDQHLILATQNLLLRQWDWKEKKLVRSWKAIHFAPIVSMALDSTSTLLATGSADSTIKVWDIDRQYCTHNLRGHQGIVSVVAFHSDGSRLLVYSAGEDYKIRVWNLSNSKCIAEIPAHYSLVTCITFSRDGSSAYTSGRDGVVSIIDTSSNTVRKTIPVFEVLESVVLVPENCAFPDIGVESGSLHFITAGNKGILRVWNSSTGKCVFTTDAIHSKNQFVQKTSAPEPESDDSQNIVQMVYNKTKNSVIVITYDQNISTLSLEKLRLQKQFAGNNDEILDVKYFGEDENYVIVATNSMLIKVFELKNWDCEILYGHTDIVLCLDVVQKSDMFISGGKDNTVRLWKINPVLKQVSCLAMCQGHTNAVCAVAMSRTHEKFFVSGSEDCTLKLWQVPDDLDPSVTVELHAAVTERAHDKNISSVAVAPNDKFIATGSMDKTAKLWKASDLSLIGVMRGHKRGIWCVQFSPIDQILATSSGDGTVKLWSLTDFSCVRTFEGHDCAVLKVCFVTRGMQLLTSGTNGLVKLWTIKNNECVKTLDEHEDKVWALAVGNSGDNFLTGGADSSLIVWKDVTEIEQNEAREKQEKFILQEQELSNLIQQKKYLKAVGLAITLEQPFRLLNILKEILTQEDGGQKLQGTLEKLRLDQIDAVLRFSVEWNTNSKHCHEAQVVLASVMKMYPPKQLRELGNLKSSVEGLLPYTERHFNRLSRLVQQSTFLNYTWQCMKGISSQQPEKEPDLLPLGAASEEQSVPEDEETSSSESSESETEKETQTEVKNRRDRFHHPQIPAKAVVRDSSKQSADAESSSNDSEETSESEEEFVIDRTGKNSKSLRKAKAVEENPGKTSKIKSSDNVGNKSKMNTVKKKSEESESESESSEINDMDIVLSKTNGVPSTKKSEESSVLEESSQSEEEEKEAVVKPGTHKKVLNNENGVGKDRLESKGKSDRSEIGANKLTKLGDDTCRMTSKKKMKKHTSKGMNERNESESDKSTESEEGSESEINISRRTVLSTGSEREIYRKAGMSERSVKILTQDLSTLVDSTLKSGTAMSETVKDKERSNNKKIDFRKLKEIGIEGKVESVEDSSGMGDEDLEITPATGIPGAGTDTDNIKKKLFRTLLGERKQRDTKRSENAPKRKLTQTYTVVKRKTPKVVGLDFIEGKLNEETLKEDNTKKRPKDRLLANKLKKLKRPGRR